MTGSPFEVLFTYEFIRRSLPEGCRRILEVGCGRGELAARLMGDGFAVIALDVDAEAVVSARRRGVEAREARWPAPPDGTFDAVLFTRSLHHLHPLMGSVAAAATCLAPNGRVVVEDFAFETVDVRTLRWFTRLIRLLQASGVLAGHSELFDRLVATGDSLEAWRKDHDHELHTAIALENALQDVFPHGRIEAVPYLFRYFSAELDGHPHRNDILRCIGEEERELIAEGAITAVGWRFVGTRRDPITAAGTDP